LGKSKHREYNKEAKDGETSKLKRRIAHLEKENKLLKSQLRTYEAAFHKNIRFLKGKTDDLSLEELIKGAQEELTVNEIKADKQYKFEDLKAKWQCFKCNEGVLRLIIIPGNRYFRKCSMCEHRTGAQEYTENVEGIR
jgi:hypothetical protein